VLGHLRAATLKSVLAAIKLDLTEERFAVRAIAPTLASDGSSRAETAFVGAEVVKILTAKDKAEVVR
jgi:hypothetical protein